MVYLVIVNKRMPESILLPFLHLISGIGLKILNPRSILPTNLRLLDVEN